MAGAFMALLEDEDSNGDVMRVYKDDKGEIIRLVLTNSTADPGTFGYLVEKSRTTAKAVDSGRKEN